MADVRAAVSARGHRAMLTEGGPRVLAGRGRTSRPGLIDGLELLPDRPEWSDLVSVRRRASYLFLRYRIHQADQSGAGHPQ
jgi:hypothetical protein